MSNVFHAAKLYNCGCCDPAAFLRKLREYALSRLDHTKAPKGRSRDEHRFPDRKDYLCCVLVDGKFQPLQEPQLHERVREGEGNAVAQTGSGRNRSHPAAGWSQHVAGRLSCGWDHSADCLSAGRVVPDARLLENGRRANEADRQHQLHEEYGARGFAIDVLAATASMADEFGD